MSILNVQDFPADPTAAVSPFTGDTGSGGTKGAVPAPAAGDTAAGKFLRADGIWVTPPTGSGSGGGTVTSVGLSMPPEFVVSHSPVTSADTLTVAKATESANQVWAGPSSGVAAAPSFRALIAGDIPPIPESGVINLTADLAAKAPLASPALTGTPSAPTASTGTNSTQVATTAFVAAQIAASAPALAPVQSVAGKTGAVTLVEADITNLVSDLAAKASLASPTFSGTPWSTTPTPATDNSTRIATTAFVQSALVAGAPPLTRSIKTSAPLTGGGNLSADRTLAVSTMTGDSGSGGADGVVPAPAAGDAAAGKYLK